MEKFEYLPQLIVAYDSKDEFANLIHVKTANINKDYYCPCCGGTVKPRALDSSKVQSHYYHIDGNCKRESQLHWFCKHWLFEKGSSFYINDILYTVNDIKIENTYETMYGQYRPDITITTTTGKVIYFEMFFKNRKRGDDYFCKWDYLGNDVVEVDIKEYISKVNKDDIPIFKYLYHNGKCYSKDYSKRDMYYNTIKKRTNYLTGQKLLNYKARIEQLDWFWKHVQENDVEEIFNIFNIMEYDDQVFCYELSKRKQCMKYLSDDFLNIINTNVFNKIRNKIDEQLDIDWDKNIYIDILKRKGRTFEIGVVLDINEHFLKFKDVMYHCSYWDDFYSLETNLNRIDNFSKIIFKSKVYDYKDIKLSEKDINIISDCYNKTLEFKKKIFNFYDAICNKYKNCDITFDGLENLVVKDESNIIFNNRHYYDVKRVSDSISNYYRKKPIAEKFSNIINSCKNTFWESTMTLDGDLILGIRGTDICTNISIYSDENKSLENILSSMKCYLNGSNGIRVMEVA